MDENKTITYKQVASGIVNWLMAQNQTDNAEQIGKIDAIKLLRTITGLGLKESKDFIDADIHKRNILKLLRDIHTAADARDIRTFAITLWNLLGDKTVNVHDVRDELLDVYSRLAPFTDDSGDES